ncbi:MAG TPA: ABC transporter permease [Polyangiaceae bacterium]|nr:MAG: Inner membrane transport permease YbhR [Deltaproteobacteria bacterium ADurb.Bin207]HNS95646.1 ABC transporter permease [Polyangiaceae bacterium]HNZ25279.1 ABC transporter permease [Polyangiaceae bacterium]HOD23114.1 ABC transporter permease [Polyangiaceae bacterium]HOE50873.1 ABC transporter permease [Polyangiaceae bacterium]
MGRTLLLMLYSVMRKEVLQAFRDKRMATLLLIAPLMQLVVLGYAVDLEVDHIPTVVCDQDRTPASRALLEATFAEGTFQRVATVTRPAEAVAQVTDGKAASAWIIPRGYEQALARGTGAAVQVLIDGTDTNRAQVASAAAQQMALFRSVEISTQSLASSSALAQRQASTAQISPVARVLYNPNLRSATYMVPGLAATVVLIVTTIVTAMGIAREKEMGTMEQLLVTPLRPWILLVGKCLPFAAVGLLDVAGVIAIGAWLFDVPLRGSLLVVFVGAAFYVLSTLGMGVFISTVSSSQQQAILGGFLFLLPAILLSGFMTPIDNMPQPIQWLTYANPVRYFIEVMRSVLLKGAGFAELGFQLVALASFGVLILALSAFRFKKQLD